MPYLLLFSADEAKKSETERETRKSAEAAEAISLPIRMERADEEKNQRNIRKSRGR